MATVYNKIEIDAVATYILNTVDLSGVGELFHRRRNEDCIRALLSMNPNDLVKYLKEAGLEEVEAKAVTAVVVRKLHEGATQKIDSTAEEYATSLV